MSRPARDAPRPDRAHSADGEHLVVTDESRAVRRINAGTGRPAGKAVRLEGVAAAVTVAADGRHAFVLLGRASDGPRSSALTACSSLTSTRDGRCAHRWLCTTAARRQHDGSYTEDGSRIVAGGEDGRVSLGDGKDGRLLDIATVEPDTPVAPMMLADGVTLLAATGDGFYRGTPASVPHSMPLAGPPAGR